MLHGSPVSFSIEVPFHAPSKLSLMLIDAGMRGKNGRPKAAICLWGEDKPRAMRGAIRPDDRYARQQIAGFATG
jgi:hypothetical protein